MVSAQSFEVELLARAALSRNVDQLTLHARSPEGEGDGSKPFLYWAAGQYLELMVQNGELSPIPYSFASAMKNQRPNQFELAVTKGVSTALDRWSIGSVCTARGPFGTFTWLDPTSEAVLLIGIGTGVAPLRALIQEELGRELATELLLLYGCRSEEDVLWGREFEGLARHMPRFRFEVTLTQPSVRWPGRRGRVQEHVADLLSTGHFLRAYVCGNRPMVGEIVATLNGLGIPASRVQAEGY